MNGWVVVIGLAVVAVALLLITGVLLLVGPMMSAALERARVHREAAEASWRIHQSARAAFAEMLTAARRSEQGEAE